MQSVIKFLKKILLVVELFFVILFVHWDKVLFVGIIALDQFCKGLMHVEFHERILIQANPIRLLE